MDTFAQTVHAAKNAERLSRQFVLRSQQPVYGTAPQILSDVLAGLPLNADFIQLECLRQYSTTFAQAVQAAENAETLSRQFILRSQQPVYGVGAPQVLLSYFMDGISSDFINLECLRQYPRTFAKAIQAAKNAKCLVYLLVN